MNKITRRSIIFPPYINTVKNSQCRCRNISTLFVCQHIDLIGMMPSCYEHWYRIHVIMLRSQLGSLCQQCVPRKIKQLFLSFNESVKLFKGLTMNSRPRLRNKRHPKPNRCRTNGGRTGLYHRMTMNPFQSNSTIISLTPSITHQNDKRTRRPQN